MASKIQLRRVRQTAVHAGQTVAAVALSAGLVGRGGAAVHPVNDIGPASAPAGRYRHLIAFAEGVWILGAEAVAKRLPGNLLPVRPGPGRPPGQLSCRVTVTRRRTRTRGASP